MSNVLRGSLIIVLTITSAFAVAVAVGSAQTEQTRGPADGVVAVIGHTQISAAQLEETIGSQLAALRSQEYNLKRQALETLIGPALLSSEAAARGLSVEELLRIEVERKAAPVTEAEVKAIYEGTRERYEGRAEVDAMMLIQQTLQRQRIDERRLAFVKELRARAGVRVLLEPPRVAVDPGNAPSKGPTGAPVTIIEFSDFQCPYCRQANVTLQKLEERYRDKVRIVFRDFPLAMHKQAPKAAEAAACAHEQGKFWEMHDRLFANQANLQVSDLKRYASEAGLDTHQFDQCLDSGKYTVTWQEGMKQGSRYGISATPTFFINGRMLVGAKPYESFAEMIDDELNR